MTDFNYQALAQRTCPEGYHAGAVPAGLVLKLMADAVNALTALDAVKKAYAYGRELPVGLKALVDDTKYAGNLDGHVLHAILGTATESGELLEAAMKTLFNGDVFDVVNFQEEMGDVAWYRAIGLAAVGQSIHDNDVQNIDKLRKRFPDKFDADRANNRDLDGERRVLEGAATATIKNARWFGSHIYGDIYDDSHGRFPDGTAVHTTDVIKQEGNVVTTTSGSVYTLEMLDKDDHAQDIYEPVIFAYGPEHDRIRGVDEEGTPLATGRIELQPFTAGDEYDGKYRGQQLATDGTTLYRLHGTLKDERPTGGEGGGGRIGSLTPNNGIARVGN